MSEGITYNIGDPREIALVYRNKQGIAQALNNGAITLPQAVLAAMTMDHSEIEKALRTQQPPTVAQQVMGGALAAPVGPPAAGGLGALPPPAPSMTPPMGPPGAPPMPPGMADGGYLPPYASGGLSDLPVPDAMFDEPGNGGYGGGGIVAFSGGNPGTMKPSTGFDESGLPTTYASTQQWYDQQMGAEPTKYADMMEAYYAKRMDPAAIAKERKQNLGLIGLQAAAALLSSKSPNFFGALGEAGEKAVPLFASMEAQRKLEEKQNIDALAGIEGQRYDRKGRRLESQLSILGQTLTRREAERAREQAERLAREQNKTTLAAARISAAPRATDYDKQVAALIPYLQSQGMDATTARAMASLRASPAALGAQTRLSSKAADVRIKFTDAMMRSDEYKNAAMRRDNAKLARLAAANEANIRKEVARLQQSMGALAFDLEGGAALLGGVGTNAGYGAPPPGAVQLIQPE